MSDDGERLARLEARTNYLEDDADTIKDEIRAIRTDIHEIKEVVSRYGGFAGGIVFAVATFAGVIGATISTLWHKITG